MRLAYVTIYESSDIRNWSGLGYYIRSELEGHGFQIKPIGNLIENYYAVTIAKKIMYKLFFAKNYKRDRAPLVLRHYAKQVEKFLASINCDVVFSPGAIPIAYLSTQKPIIFWSDSTFTGMIDFYPGNTNLCNETIRDGYGMEQLALSKCRLAIYSSEWAAKSAINDYDVDPNKVKVVPFGANIDCNRDTEEIKQIISNKAFETCKLLFIGVDWFRKGGDIAIKVATLLNRQGMKTELHIVGCDPPDNMPSFVKLHGFVSKRTEDGRNLLDKLFKESHFLIVPSRAECFGVVFCEASSFGLPSLATDVGGIPTAVHAGKNGQLFSLDDDPERYCEYISKVVSSRQEYEQLCMSSFQEYTDRLNWTSAGKKVHDLIIDSCG